MQLRELTVTSAGLTIATTAYTSGDQVGTVFTFTPAISQVGMGIDIVGALLLDEGDVLAACDLVLFTGAAAPTLAGDNNPFAISDADARNIRGLLTWTTGDVLDIGNNRFGQWRPTMGPTNPIYMPTNTLYGALITRSANAVFTAVTDVRISLLIKE